MRISLKDVLSQLFLVSLMIMLLACSGSDNKSGKSQSEQIPDKYADWQRYSYKNLRIYYPTGYKFADSMNSYANKY